MAHKAVQRLVRIEADADGNAPSAIHLMSVGHWHTPWHGAFEHTASDLADMVIHFEEGVGLLLNKKTGQAEAPINYGHERGGKASGWITSLYLEAGGTELWGNTRWTKEGERALQEEEYKYISPEWNPRDFPWENPEVEGEFVENVFTGAALTNIPLFKKLTPVMASQDDGQGSDNQSNKAGDDMNLDQVRVKKPEELTPEEQTFLEENKGELTDVELVTFGLAEGSSDDSGDDSGDDSDAGDDDQDENKDADDEQSQSIEASAFKGYTAEKLAQLEADAKAGRAAQQKLLKTELTASVTTAITRGAIKSDQLDATVELLMASSDAQREKLTSFIAGLPDNQLLAGESGSNSTETAVTLTDEEIAAGEDFNLTKEELMEYKKSKQD